MFPRNRHVALIAALLASAALLPAQLQISAVVNSEWKATAVGVPDATLPVGTVLVGGETVTAWSECAGFPASGSVGYSVATAGFAFWAGANSFCAGGASGSGGALVTLTSPVPIAGSLRITASALGGSSSADIGNDGLSEVSGSTLATTPTVGEFPVIVDATGVQVAVYASALAATFGSSLLTSGSGGIRILFDPMGIVVPEGAACGPDLDAWYLSGSSFFFSTFERLELRVTNSPVTPNAFFVLGVQQLQLPIPPRFCVLRTDILIAVPVVPSPSGAAGLTVQIPMGMPFVDFRMQYLVAPFEPMYGTTVWQTSEGMHFRLAARF